MKRYYTTNKNKFESLLYIGSVGNTLIRMGTGALWLMLIGLFACSCDDFVAVSPPNAQLDSGAVFEQRATATAAMTDIYARMRENGMLAGTASGLSHLLGLYTDELDYYGTSLGVGPVFYNNTLVATNTEVGAFWNYSYSQIYAANAVIAGVAKSKSLPQADRDQLTGEALFVRALLHTCLAGTFGKVPYVATTDYKINKQVTREPVATVYEKAMADLETAISLLPEQYQTPDRTRPNRYAAYALYARVALYAGKNDIASNAASAVLNNTDLYANTPSLSGTFLKESTATIWQFAPGVAGNNTLEAQTFTFISGPPPLSALTPALEDAFEAGDQRKTLWTTAIAEGTTTWYHPGKYRDTATGSATEFSIVLRLGELYLIRAEARARQGELIQARDDLDVVRHLAGLGDSPADTQAALLDAILAERRVELFTEFGHRFFDLKRFGRIDTALGTKSGWEQRDALFPIPQTELSANPRLLPQNTGY